MPNKTNQIEKEKPKKLVTSMAEKYGVSSQGFWDTLKATAFKQRNNEAPTDAQMMALLVVANEYDLNPFTKEIYAFPDKSNGIVPIVGVDGWSRIINNHSQFDGMEFTTSSEKIELVGLDNPIFEWIECTIYRKDRTRPIKVREYLEEVYREPISKSGNRGPYTISGPWQTHPRRMARHKVLIQCARIALGYTGIFDEDEAERIFSKEKVINSQSPVEIELPAAQPAVEFQMDSPATQATSSVTIDGASEVVEQPEELPQDSALQTPFGSVSGRDANMIDQMIAFTTDAGTWQNTKDSFQERYQGATLEFALAELTKAKNKSLMNDAVEYEVCTLN